MRRPLLRFLLLIVALILFTSCSNPPYQDSGWPVYYELDLTSAIAKPLLTPGGYVYITEAEVEPTALGLGGILLIRSLVGDSQGEAYYAYDLACPVEKERGVRVVVNNKLEAECPSCKSTFSILYGGGGPTSGTASIPLFAYRTYHTGNRIVVTNR